MKFVPPVFYELQFGVDATQVLHPSEVQFDEFFEYTGLGQRIVIQGKSGIGKTTFVNHLIKEWSFNKKASSEITKCPLLLRVTLRDLKTERPSGQNTVPYNIALFWLIFRQ